MNWRKILNKPNSIQKNIIIDEKRMIDTHLSKLAESQRKEQKESQHFHDNICPNCRATQDAIVDKISSVVGKGNVRGNLFVVYGSSSIETKAVNHCNNCGHQWMKYKTKSITKFEVIMVVFRYLYDVIIEPERNKDYTWKHDAIKFLKNCHAESIFLIQNDNTCSIKTKLKLKQLRKKYESIYIDNAVLAVTCTKL